MDVEKRLDNIEDVLKILNTLPARVGDLETQFLLLRTEMREEFSATRSELRSEFRRDIAQLRDQTLAQFAEVHERIDRLDARVERQFAEQFEKLKALLRPKT